MARIKRVAGERIGTKRSDMRWKSPDGEEWDSRYEYSVWCAFKAKGYKIRRCDKSDTFSFTLPIRGASCRACGSAEVGQQRHYTPDFHVTPPDKEPGSFGYYVEAKGYLRAKQRSLLRNFHKENPDSGVRYLLQRDFPISKRSSVTAWFSKFFKKSIIAIWDGSVPKVW